MFPHLSASQLLIVLHQGTMHFMSVEVAAQKFLFQPRFVNITDFMQDVRNTSGIRKTTIVPFSHNHLHDLESLWWVAVWMVFYNRFSKAQRSDDEPPFTLTEAERQLKLSQVLFPSLLKNTDHLSASRFLFKKHTLVYRGTRQFFAVT
jgi:Fungal protein kinase